MGEKPDLTFTLILCSFILVAVESFLLMEKKKTLLGFLYFFKYSSNTFHCDASSAYSFRSDGIYFTKVFAKSYTDSPCISIILQWLSNYSTASVP